jgi:hypothetical protein
MSTTQCQMMKTQIMLLIRMIMMNTEKKKRNLMKKTLKGNSILWESLSHFYSIQLFPNICLLFSFNSFIYCFYFFNWGFLISIWLLDYLRFLSFSIVICKFFGSFKFLFVIFSMYGIYMSNYSKRSVGI